MVVVVVVVDDDVGDMFLRTLTAYSSSGFT